MVKKQRRQHDNYGDKSEESTESGEGYNKGMECSHFPNAISLPKLRKVTSTNNRRCLDCEKNGNNGNNVAENDNEFSDEPLPLWICLQCGNVGCGRTQQSHAIDHYEKPRSDLHCVVIDTHNWSLWCYKCDKAIRSNRNKKRLHEITEILKKWMKSSKSSTPSPPKSRIPLCQNETISTNNEKKKILYDLPKVGGLTNLGNTCFFNAVLQCLAQTPYLIKVLDDLQVPDQTFKLPGGKFKEADDEEIELPPIEGVLEKELTFTPVLRKTLSDMQNCDGQVYRPVELYNALKKKTLQCTDGGQHDSHELLRHLLECVRNEDVRRYQDVILKEVGLSAKSKPHCVPDNLKSRVKFYGNQVANNSNGKFLGPERVFRGELVSTLECLECHHSSIRTEPFLDLSLPVLIDKSLPTILKRKNNSFDHSVDSISNNISTSPSKHELKKAQNTKRRNKLNKYSVSGYRAKEHNNLTAPNLNRSEEKKGNESEESDADIEDNIENEESSVNEVGESGYSSEKPSAVTSPVLLELRASYRNDKNEDCKIETNDISPYNNYNFAVNSNNSDDDPMNDLTENKNNITAGLTLSTSLTVNSDFTSPDGPTISPLSSPLTSKDSPTSPISSAVDGDDAEKVGKLILRFDESEKHDDEKSDPNDKEESPEKSNDLLNESSSNHKEIITTNKVTNGVGDITSNVAKLNLSSPLESPTRYPTKEGECSIQLCLNQFTALELMNGNNKVGCTACTERANKGKKEGVKMVCTDSTKQYLISRVPAVLILHLKRFQVQKYSFRKVGKHVSFPMLLNLAPVSKDYTKPSIYSLYGVVEHSGTLYGGHYVAYVKSRAPLKPSDPRWAFLPSKDGFESKDPSSESNSDVESDKASGTDASSVEPPPGRWYYVSDSRVHEVDEKTVLNSEAYLLFYERIL